VTFALLADENFPGPVIDGLVAAGHDVLSIARTTPGINDRSVLDLARQMGRRLLTFDSDFGDLVFFHAAPPPVAILYFRMHPIIVKDVLEAALRALTETPDGHFAVVGREGTRLRPLQPEHKVE
jgi:predicted nuclease of predicted toxin-antitoxin system